MYIENIIAIANRSHYFTKSLVKGHIARNTGKTILFPHHRDWELKIKFGFALTPYRIVFSELTPENIGNYDMVVPIDIGDAKTLNELRHLIPNNPLPIPSWDVVQLCNDKDIFNTTLGEIGFGHLIPTVKKSLQIPYILKKKVDAWGKNTYLVDSETKAQLYSKKLSDPDYFVQQLIPGSKEYATHIIMKDRKILCSLNVEYTFGEQFPIKGKTPLRYKKIVPCPFLGEFTDMLNRINYQGLCCLNYKTLEGKPYLIENNPRFGGSLAPFFFAFVPYLLGDDA